MAANYAAPPAGPAFAAPTAPAGATAPAGLDYTDVRLARFRELAGRFEIRPDFCTKLRQLEGYEIVILCDDSGSMSTPITQSPATADPFARTVTRWDELRHYVSIVTDIAAVLDPTGIDLYFLNRPPMHGISNAAQIQPAFGAPPAGYTPLSRTIRQIMAEKAAVLAEKKMLLIIATDGQPTDDAGNVRLDEFFATLRSRPRNMVTAIIACTDDDSAVAYLNTIDREVPGVDTCDDYASEKREVLRSRGARYAFSFGDYVCKTLLGPIDPTFDRLDGQNTGEGGSSCCTVV